ncbi:hypothetical protein RFI_33632, partial [Reticulomyxa filosa]
MACVLHCTYIPSYPTKVTNATKDTLYGLADISFSTSSSLVLNVENITFELADEWGTTIGYTTIDDVQLAPGFNYYSQVPTIITLNAGNTEAVERFFSQYMMGQNQVVRILGPSPINGRKTVVDYAINQTIIAL